MVEKEIDVNTVLVLEGLLKNCEYNIFKDISSKRFKQKHLSHDNVNFELTQPNSIDYKTNYFIHCEKYVLFKLNIHFTVEDPEIFKLCNLLNAEAFRYREFSYNTKNGYHYDKDKCEAGIGSENVGNQVYDGGFWIGVEQYNIASLLLSLTHINNLLFVLKRNQVKVDFDLRNIVEAITEKCKQLNKVSLSTVTLNNLAIFLNNNPELPAIDAIYIFYCFVRSLGGFDYKLILKGDSKPITVDDLFLLADKVLSCDHNHQFKVNHLNMLIDQFNLCQKAKFYIHCFYGKLNSQGELYGWESEAWRFLKVSTFKLDSKRNIFISGCSDKEFSLFGEFVGDIDPSCMDDVELNENTIIITGKLAQILFEMNLHYDSDHVKQLFRERRNLRFFKQVISEPSDFSKISDVAKDIFDQAAPCINWKKNS